MLYHLFYNFIDKFPALNVIRYITFRGGCAFITSFALVFFLWKYTLKKLAQLKMTETIDMYGHKGLESLHQGKKGTPTMGGVLIIAAVLFSTLLWTRWDSYFMWLSIFSMVGLGALGLYDDLLKTKKGKGLTRSEKLLSQIVIGLMLGALAVVNPNVSTTWDFPFFKRVVIDLGYYYIFWATLVIVATSNAVNFTDGLDGLAIGSVIINSFIFAIFCYLSGHAKFSQYLYIPYIRGAGELTIFCFSLVGAGLGFLWFNSYPAQIFMGDVGALSLGGVIGAIALFIKKEFLLVISGGLLVAEVLSVIIQIISIKTRKKKVFLASPLHHHFQLLGWKEPKIIIRFWIVSILLAVATLLTLKLR